MNRLMNQPWRVKRRLLAHRDEEAGQRVHGRAMARAMRGIPKMVGLWNWLKRFSIMVRFRL